MILNTTFLTQLIQKHAVPGLTAYITDANSHILASTDESRVGKNSTTAQFILKSGRPAIIEHEDSFLNKADTRDYITYGTLITNLEEVIGIIICSGPHNAATSLGSLLRASLETAFEYQSFTQSILHAGDERSIIARALIDNTMARQKIITSMNKIEMDPTLIRCVICINLEHHRPSYFNINLNLGYQSSIERINEDIIKRVRACRFFNTQDLILAYDRNTIIVIKSFIQNSEISRAYLALDIICDEIGIILKLFTSFTYRIAYGNLYPEISDVKKSFSEATETIRIGKKTHPNDNVYTLDKLMFDHVCHNIDPQIVNKIILPAINALNFGDKAFPIDIIDTANAFVDNCLSLSSTSAATFQHRNTIRNRLEKLKEKTSLDPASNFSDAFIVKMIWTYMVLTANDEVVEKTPNSMSEI